MQKIKIRFPIWKTRSVGIAREKITDDILVTIDYRTQGGSKLYPDGYFMTKENALKYPIQLVKGVALHIIPISDFEVLDEGEDLL